MLNFVTLYCHDVLYELILLECSFNFSEENFKSVQMDFIFGMMCLKRDLCMQPVVMSCRQFHKRMLELLKYKS